MSDDDPVSVNEQRLREIRERESKATPDDSLANNQAFVSHARDDVRWLLAEVERIDKRRRDVESVLGWLGLAVAKAAGVEGAVTGEELVERVAALRRVGGP